MAADPCGVGDLVGLLTSAGPRLAVVIAVRGNRAELRIGHEGKVQSLPLRDLVQLARHGADTPSAARPQRIDDSPWAISAAKLATVRPRPREFGAAWLLLVDGAPPGGTDLAGLVDLVGDGSDPVQRAASWLWLHGDQTLFRWRQQQLEARPAGELRSLRHQRQLQRLQEQRRSRWRETLRARQPVQAEALDPVARSDLQQLRRWAGGDTDTPLPAELQKLLHGIHCPLEPGALRHLLADLGQWERHQLPALEATTWQLGFSADLLQDAERLLAAAAEPRPGDGQRHDRTAQWVVTIDDADTQDIDDGLGLEWLVDGTPRLWIHIADPGRLVEPGTPLDHEARRRASSLYLAGGNLPMFPPQLAHGPMSLRSGSRCAAWSLWVDLDAEGAVVADGLERTWIRPGYRLAYADAEELIELAPPQERELLAIHTLLERRQRWRLGRGALQLEDPEGRIRCQAGAEGGVQADLHAVVEVVEPSAARRMVAEAMVLAGALVAQRGQRHGLALPYRSQPSAELPSAAELEALPPGPVRHAAIKRCLGRGLVGTTAAPHFSLGLPAYVQATSPIRRYADLLVQRQLEALLQGDTPLSEPELALVLEALEGPLRQGVQISRDDQRHWLQVWFEQQQPQALPALFLRWLRADQQLGLVWLEALCQSLPCHCPPRSEPGRQLLVRVVEVDSLRDTLRLEAST